MGTMRTGPAKMVDGVDDTPTLAAVGAGARAMPKTDGAVGEGRDADVDTEFPLRAGAPAADSGVGSRLGPTDAADEPLPFSKSLTQDRDRLPVGGLQRL